MLSNIDEQLTKDFMERKHICDGLRNYRAKLCKKQADKGVYCTNCDAEVDHSRCCISMVLRAIGG
jgi:hypothetical protein